MRLPFEGDIKKQFLAMAILAVVSVVVLVVVWMAIDSSLDASSTVVTIRVQSDTSWSGAIGTSDGTRSVEGAGSADYELTGDSFSAVIHKETESGYLTVSIVADGVVKATDTTTEDYGTVLLWWGDF